MLENKIRKLRKEMNPGKENETEEEIFEVESDEEEED
jgi:hypothetical protein